MNVLRPLGRVLYALPFIFFGVNHFINVDWYDATYTSFVPLGPFTIMLTGVLLIVAGISIITKKFITLSAITLAVMLLIFILTIHVPHLLKPDSDKSIVIITLLKDISLMGGSLMIAGICSDKDKKNNVKL